MAEHTPDPRTAPTVPPYPDPSTLPPVPLTPMPPRNPTEPPPEPPVPAGTSGSPDAELTTVGQDGAFTDGGLTDGALTDGGLTDDGTVPTFDDVRSKIENRVARAGGQSELDADSAVGRRQAQTEEQRAKAAQDALDKIRASMRDS